jgi:hypothetical protein
MAISTGWTVQSPSAGLDATERLIGKYAAECGFRTDAVAGWRTSTARRGRRPTR